VVLDTNLDKGAVSIKMVHLLAIVELHRMAIKHFHPFALWEKA